MTHSPPVPPANQSPYPHIEEPHEHQASGATNDMPTAGEQTASADIDLGDEADGKERLSGLGLGRSLAALLGIATVATSVFLAVTAASRSSDQPLAKKGKKSPKKPKPAPTA